MNQTSRPLAILALLLFGALPASAEDGAIELKTTAARRIVVPLPDGTERERFVPAARVVPGDVVAYTIEAKNISPRPAERVTITDPIPEHMHYLGGAAEGVDAEVLFSVDGGMRFDRPERLTVVEADGARRPATALDYTHVRWILAEPLAPSQTQSVKFLAELQ